MEGFLLKKVKERSFGSGWLGEKAKSWKKQWFILDDQTVTFYEDFDLMNNKPVKENGSFSIAGCEVLPVAHKTRKFVFCVEDPVTDNKLMYVQADDAKLMGVWIKALTAAAKGEHLAPVIDYDYYYRVLGLDPDEHHEPSVVNRAFRTLVAEAPVGKDGKAEGFKELQEAFNHIMAHLNDIEEAQLYRMAFYEAVVIKGGPGEGLGIVVQEEIDRRNVVKGLRDSLRIKSITGEVGEDGIEVGDQLVRLGNDDVSTMPLVRVAQRMNDFRIPPRSAVRLVFGRKVLRTDHDPEESEYGDLRSQVFSGTLRSESFDQSEANGPVYQNPAAHPHYGQQQHAYQEEPAYQEPEYTRAPSQHSLSRTNSGNDMYAGQSTRSNASRPTSRNQSRSGSPGPTLEPEPERASIPRQSSTSSVSRPLSTNRKESPVPPLAAPAPQYSPASSNERSMSRAGSFSTPKSGSTKHPFAAPANEQSSPSPKAQTLSRQASFVGAFGLNAVPPPAIAPTPAPAPQPAAPVTEPAPAARPLSTSMQVEAINSKEYFRRSSVAMKSPAEIGEMKRDLDFCLKELQHASKRVEELEYRNGVLESELARYKALYADSARHERLLETQLEQYLIHSTVTTEFIEGSMNDMIYVSNQISTNQPIPISNEVTTYLDELGLGETESELDGSKASQRNAIAATAAIDKSGLMLQKWAMTGDSIMDKLSRLENRVQRMEGNFQKPPTAPQQQPSPTRTPPLSPAQHAQFTSGGGSGAVSMKHPPLHRPPSQQLSPTLARSSSATISPTRRGPPALNVVPVNLSSTTPGTRLSPKTGDAQVGGAPLLRQGSQTMTGDAQVGGAPLLRQGSQTMRPAPSPPGALQHQQSQIRSPGVPASQKTQPLASALMSRPLNVDR